ncbi:DUF1919 domain-containing protein [Allofournierella sp.]|uniref:DUF1919 domain-containing protein n=1 Tax=Allofournierella sp. TaxID=1940256 RepID=UPI003AB859EE
MVVKETLKTLRYAMRDHLINRPNRARLKNHSFTIIASDCVGGMIYHDLKECFNSPTINMFFSATDYLKFISAPQAYLDLLMQEVKDEIHFYKMAKIGNGGGSSYFI